MQILIMDATCTSAAIVAPLVAGSVAVRVAASFDT